MWHMEAHFVCIIHFRRYMMQVLKPVKLYRYTNHTQSLFVCSAIVDMDRTNNNRRVVLWFRNDLRIHDNEIIHQAVQRVSQGKAAEVVPVYCFDPKFFSESHFSNGHLKTGAFRAKFLIESVQDLKKNLREYGSDLIVQLGAAEETLPKLVKPGSIVLAQAEVTSEESDTEVAVRKALEKSSSKLELVWGSTLYHRDDVPFDYDMQNMPTVFTPFRQKCEDRAPVRQCFPLPPKEIGVLPLPKDIHEFVADLNYVPQTIEDLNSIVPSGSPLFKIEGAKPDAKAVIDFQGGETEALKRLDYYLWQSDLIKKYFEIRNGMIGGDYSTKLAPALTHGCISPRQMYWEIQKYEKQRGSNKSTYWVIFELIWRDFFKFYALKEGNEIFKLWGPIGKRRTWKDDSALFDRWRYGQTGWPLVDANMRELLATGFMSNRGRQNVASFLALDLGLDWRKGADWFESLLLDYDVASNWGNWVAAAGLTGGRINKFNITKQSKDYDPDGKYIRLWCPELKNVPASKIHQPHLMSIKEQELYGVRIGIDYPQAIPSSSFASSQNRPPPRFGKKGGKSRSRAHPQSEIW